MSRPHYEPHIDTGECYGMEEERKPWTSYRTLFAMVIVAFGGVCACLWLAFH